MASYFSQLDGRRVFVTGHTGFKGSWLIYWLHRLGAVTRGYSLKPAKNELYDQIDGDALCDSVIADIRDIETLRAAVLDFKPDIFLHLAAQSLVGESYEVPLETFDVNAMGTANCLEVIRGLEGNCSTVVITTDKVYENIESGRPFATADKLGGHDPYSASKACAEIIVDSYRKSFLRESTTPTLPVATARAGNVIGGGDWNKNHLVPDIANALARDLPVQIRNPRSVRPWQHVLEPLAGYLKLALLLEGDPLKYSRAWNFGPELSANIEVELFVRMAVACWGGGRYENAAVADARHEAGLLRLDIDETIADLDWRPVFSVDEAINLTFDWYRKLPEAKGNIRELLDHDINAYLGKVE